MNEGKLVADLDIPSDTYTWEKLKIELENMRGRVQFNLPIKSVDNNLTETFQVDRIRWKQLHMEDAHLSVTYDMNGIYGKFGGAAYEGYVNGEFNIYLDTNFSWDGWITGTWRSHHRDHAEDVSRLLSALMAKSIPRSSRKAISTRSINAT